jgi:hypothetical protein
LFYSTATRQPVEINGEGFFDGAATRAMVGKARIAAFGFSIQSFADDWSRDIGKLMVANAVQWAAGRPTWQIAPWPNGRSAAAVPALEEDEDVLDAEGIGDTLPDARLRRALAGAKSEAERSSQRTLLGLLPPERHVTVETLQFWADLGGDYAIGPRNGRAAAPEIIPLLPDSLTLLNRVPQTLGEVVAYRGLFFGRTKRAPSVWTTTAGDVARWWRARAAIAIEPGADSTGIRVRNRGTAPFADGVLILDAADGKRTRIALPVLQVGGVVEVNSEGRVSRR